jgi:hypothetical protein
MHNVNNTRASRRGAVISKVILITGIAVIVGLASLTIRGMVIIMRPLPGSEDNADAELVFEKSISVEMPDERLDTICELRERKGDVDTQASPQESDSTAETQIDYEREIHRQQQIEDLRRDALINATRRPEDRNSLTPSEEEIEKADDRKIMIW